MKIRMENLATHLVALARQLRDARCQAQADGVAVLRFDEEITIQAEIVVDGGLNALIRPEVTINGPGVTRTVQGESVVRDESGLAESTTTVVGFTATSTRVETAEKSVSKDITPESISVTERTSEQSEEISDSTESQTGETLTGTSGGDTRTTINTFE